ncbi:MAG TPA: chemotaxis protein CheW [Gemmatimonadales bacterium]
MTRDVTEGMTEEVTEPTDDPAAAARILEERARRLAMRPAAATTGELVELLGFTLGGSRLAIESRFVVAVVREVLPTPLPGAVAPVAAVVAWRGRVMTVLELHTVLAAAAGAPSRALPHMLVLGETAPELGLLVDDVDALVTIEASELRPVPEGTPARAEYLNAMAPDTIPVLDAAAILRLHAADA